MTTKQTVEQDRMGRKLKGDLKTQSGYDVKVAYGPEDIADLDYKRDLNDPGSYPFTRGTYPKMYREKLWVRGVLPGHIQYAADRGGSPDDDCVEMFDKGVITSGIRTGGDYHNLATIDPDHPLIKYDIDSCITGTSYSTWQYLYGSKQWWAKEVLTKSITEGLVVELGHAVGPADVCEFTMYLAALELMGYDWT